MQSAAPVAARFSGSSSSRERCASDWPWPSRARASPILSGQCRPRLCYAVTDSKAARSPQRTGARALPGSAPHKPRAAASDSAILRPDENLAATRRIGSHHRRQQVMHQRVVVGPTGVHGRARKRVAETPCRQSSAFVFQAGRQQTPSLQESAQRKVCRRLAPQNPSPVRERRCAAIAPRLFSVRLCTIRAI